jgi:hypothetical protein
MSSWIDEELQGSEFKDKRLKSRLFQLVSQMAAKVGESLPTACQDWANTKAAYRFFSNPNLDEGEILAGHFQSTRERFRATEGLVLVLHDTTEITYKRVEPEKVGFTRKCGNPKGLFHQKIKRAQCGILMHSSLVLTTEGLPLGFAAKRFWSRDKFKGAKALSAKKNATRIPIEKKESYRWIENLKDSDALLGDAERIVHVGDRESDIYDFFRAAYDNRSHFLVRIKVNRRTEDETVTIYDAMESAKKRGFHRTSYRDKDGEEISVNLEIRFEKLTIKPSYGPKTKIYPDTQVTVIYAREVGKPQGSREPIDWRLMTNLPVDALADAVEKLEWYALRWKIEVFFKILKSGCKIEESKLRSADGLAKLISIYSILSWRIFWMTMMNRETEGISPKAALTHDEIKILDHLKPGPSKAPKTLSTYLTKIARLGGYLARASDPPPGNKVFWRGMEKLAMIQIGFELGKLVGN